MLRYRMTLVRLQTGVKNRIHATLHRHGILHEFSDLFGKKGLAWLEQLSVDPAALRESARGTLSGYLRLLRQLRGQLADVTGELRRQVRRSATGELWRSLPGVSFILAYTILAETGRIERFKNGRHLCSYSLLAPMADDSGEEDGVVPVGRHVGHLGRVTLKWAFIQAARRAVRKSVFFKEIFHRRTDGGKRDRQRGYIAVARELCRVGFSCVKNNRRFIEQRPQRPRAEPAEPPATPNPGPSSRPGVRRARSPLGRRRELIS